MRRSSRVVPRIILALATAVLVAAAPAAATEPSRALMVAGDSPTDVVAVFRGAIKGVAVVSERPGGDARVLASFHGLDPDARYRLVGSTTPCAQERVPAGGYIRFGGGGAITARTTLDGVIPEGVDTHRSLRLLRTKPSSAQVGCAAATLAGRPVSAATDGTSPAIALVNVMVTSFMAPDRPNGIVLADRVDADTIGLSWELHGQGGGAHRLVGSTAPCGTKHTAGKTVFSRSVESPSLGFQTMINGQSGGYLESVRAFRGSGFGDQRACSGIIAILIGL